MAKKIEKSSREEDPPDLDGLEKIQPVERIPGRNSTKADLLFYDLDGRRVALKTYAARPFLIRHLLGRWLIRREVAAFRAAEEVPGVPLLFGRVGPFALATEWVDAQPVSKLGDGGVDRVTLDRAAEVLAGLHDRGVAAGDLHHRDVLVAEDGAVYLVDFATSWILGPSPGRLRRSLFDHLCNADRVGLARIRARYTGVDEAEAIAAVGQSAAAWHRRGRRLKAGLDRLRGKSKR